MAITEAVRDLIGYPTKVKSVVLDLQKVVPIDNSGDEVYVLTASGSSTVSKISGGTITPFFIREFKAGYFKSSGFKSAPFTLSGTNNTLRVSIDGSAFETVVLATGTKMSGTDIATDIQNKINLLAASGSTQANKPEFLNATVEFSDNRFKFISGGISNTYTGLAQSSFVVTSGEENDASVTLGIDKGISSLDLTGKAVVETTVSVSYTSGTTLSVESSEGLVPNEAYCIYDGTHKEYFVASGVSVGQLELVGEGLTHDYEAGAVVQRIFERDPSGGLASPFENIDALTRYALRSIANQIDFTA